MRSVRQKHTVTVLVVHTNEYPPELQKGQEQRYIVYVCSHEKDQSLYLSLRWPGDPGLRRALITCSSLLVLQIETVRF